MWSDHETDQDFLGFTHLVKAVTDVVTREDLRRQDRSRVFGLSARGRVVVN